MSGYPVPAGRTRVETRAGNSRFITTLDRASTVAEARAFVRAIREEMPDATHHVYAMKIGHGASVIEGMSDDGEPAGTSGPPVLAVLRGSPLGDTVLVVTRYYGGTKLGTGGLVAAYSDAARAAIAAAATITKVERRRVKLIIDYGHYQRVRDLLTVHDALSAGEEFADQVVLSADCPVSGIESLRAAVVEATAGRMVWRESGAD
jgi:uncharacterized YigZ family protein